MLVSLDAKSAYTARCRRPGRDESGQRHTLRLQGHEVEVAHDGYCALEIAARFEPEVVLLDIGLPGLNGYDVAKQLRQMNHQRPQCLIAMTGYGSDEDRQRTEEAGFDHHIVKPIEPAELNKLLARSIAAMGG